MLGPPAQGDNQRGDLVIPVRVVVRNDEQARVDEPIRGSSRVGSPGFSNRKNPCSGGQSSGPTTRGRFCFMHDPG